MKHFLLISLGLSLILNVYLLFTMNFSKNIDRNKSELEYSTLRDTLSTLLEKEKYSYSFNLVGSNLQINPRIVELGDTVHGQVGVLASNTPGGFTYDGPKYVIIGDKFDPNGNIINVLDSIELKDVINFFEFIPSKTGLNKFVYKYDLNYDYIEDWSGTINYLVVEKENQFLDSIRKLEKQIWNANLNNDN